MRVIVCEDRELITKEELYPVHTFDGFVESDTERDILKLVILNRYQTAPPAIAFIKGTGLKLGAIAQSISHDSHNIIAIGVTDFELMQAINAVIKAKGGIAVSSSGRSHSALAGSGIDEWRTIGRDEPPLRRDRGKDQTVKDTDGFITNDAFFYGIAGDPILET